MILHSDVDAKTLQGVLEVGFSGSRHKDLPAIQRLDDQERLAIVIAQYDRARVHLQRFDQLREISDDLYGQLTRFPTSFRRRSASEGFGLRGSAAAAFGCGI